MSDIKLFKVLGETVGQVPASSAALEKSLQVLMEKHLDALLGVRFLATEFSTGAKHAGRIDTLGIDDNDCPVIIEYKRAINQNVINQGLFYLDWLMDHQADFKLLVMEKLGVEAAKVIDWSGVRLICVAGDYTRYDQYAVDQIKRNIDLIRYARYGEDLLLLELVNPPRASVAPTNPSGKVSPNAKAKIDDLLLAFHEHVTSLGDDVQVKPTKLYTAYRRLKNFACVHRDASQLRVWLKVDPDSVTLEEGFTRDVRGIGHWGTGDLELLLKVPADLHRAKDLLQKAYDEN